MPIKRKRIKPAVKRKLRKLKVEKKLRLQHLNEIIEKFDDHSVIRMRLQMEMDDIKSFLERNR
jgi:hypothetical protein